MYYATFVIIAIYRPAIYLYKEPENLRFIAVVLYKEEKRHTFRLENYVFRVGLHPSSDGCEQKHDTTRDKNESAEKRA